MSVIGCFGISRRGTVSPALRAVAIFLLVYVMAPIQAAGQGLDVFAVRGIDVDETAESDALAKDRGIAVAKQEALSRLFARLTMPEDAERLPSVGSERLEFLLRDVAIETEKFGGGRYLATLSVRFQADAVRDLLRRAGVAYVETASPRLLSVPMLRTAEGDILWREGNPWLDAWAALEPTERMVMIVPPLGDLADMAAIDAPRAAAGDLTALSALAQRYGTAGAMVSTLALATTAEGMNKADVGVTIYGPGWGGRAFVGSYVETAALAAEAAASETDPGLQELARLRLFLKDVAGQISDQLELAWKRDNLLRFDLGSRTIEVLAPLSGLGDWLAVRRGLAAAPPVSAVALDSLSIQEAKVALTFVGDEAKLAVALAQVGLDLAYSDEDATWTVTRRQ